MSPRSPHLSLPSPYQVWSHSTCSTQALEIALSEDQSPRITAIEADIVMGQVLTESFKKKSMTVNNNLNHHHHSDVILPIMAHPPQRESDLTLERFLERTIPGTIHLKLDFKESSVLVPSLDLIAQRFHTMRIKQQKESVEREEKKGKEEISSTKTETVVDTETIQTLFLNCDILSGPGYRYCHPKMDADFFISTCLGHEILETYSTHVRVKDSVF